jgi:hypothetical protein
MILCGETVGTQMREQKDKNDNNSLLLVLLLASPVETTNSDNLRSAIWSRPHPPPHSYP